MDNTPLYHEIAESIRQEILYGTLKPNDMLPAVRELSDRWNCAPGTVQRAYKELARQGLIISRPGAGTQVAPIIENVGQQTPLRRALLINQAESFLLSAVSSGYKAEEIEQALRLALDRWRVPSDGPVEARSNQLRFVGSHDPAVSLVFARLSEKAATNTILVSFAGSLGGLMALARHEADFAGSHLWDEAADTYNRTFVQHLLPGQRIALLKLADRRLGLLTAPDNPLELAGIEDLTGPGIRFINRQEGAGTRVWLDAQLRQRNIQPRQIAGYKGEALTHTELASSISSDRANVGLGIEASALAYGLGFVPLTTECYDFVIPEEAWNSTAIQSLVSVLAAAETRETIDNLGGYDSSQTGNVEWID